MVHQTVVFTGSHLYSFIPPRDGGQALNVFLGDKIAPKHMILGPPPPNFEVGVRKVPPKYQRKKIQHKLSGS
jgi:hypothetical protein